MLLKERWKCREEEKEDVSSYWMTLRKQEDTENRKRKHYNHILCRTHFQKGHGPVIRQTTE
jgi:hypothetical protein